jgi:hypothetical protein
VQHRGQGINARLTGGNITAEEAVESTLLGNKAKPHALVSCNGAGTFVSFKTLGIPGSFM